MTRTASRHLTVVAVAAAAALGLSGPALAASADTLPAAGCTTCTATFDTVGPAFDIDIPTGITGLTVTVAGAAGAAPAMTIEGDPTAVGGGGGVTTVDLGTTYAGQTLIFGVGGVGEGSYLQDTLADLLIVAGGGGQGGYAGRFDIPGQIFATYPGGNGGAPDTNGFAGGGDGQGPVDPAANGVGGSDLGGAGGVGDTNGLQGESGFVVPAGTTLGAGGAGAVTVVNEVEYAAGAGGTGVGGGGGGAIVQVEIDENPLNFAAPGGGGSGYVHQDILGDIDAGEPNPELSGYVSFTWTLPALPATGVAVNPALPAIAGLLVLAGAAALVLRRRTVND